MNQEHYAPFLPPGVLNYFSVSNIEQSDTHYVIYLEEKNLPPTGYIKAEIESKGFYEVKTHF